MDQRQLTAFMADGATVASILAAAGWKTSFSFEVIRSIGITPLNAIDADYFETEVRFTTAR